MSKLKELSVLRAVLWDMDGTLVNSEPLWGEVTYAMSEEMGRRITPAQRQATVGGSMKNTIGICSRHAGLELQESDYRKWRRYMLDNVAVRMREDLQLFPGIQDLLLDVHRHAIPMAICTNTEREVALPAFDAIGLEVFDATICGDEVTHPKPAPDMYIKAAGIIGVDPKNCLVFEDSEAGMQAAVDAGCVVIGVPEDTAGVPDRVTLLQDLQGSTDYRHTQFEDLQRWFEMLR